ncbi:DNA-directed RNA polymerase subunit alpha [Candidatus Nomurabacteria bacterium]|uniref:DNA-directed RNA polymerase subunit alpha n=1 Tax=candidate division WWE3 bacterium TaxID=2053526 RepID=A0A955IW18_UNCKA|nr:DNA-directed RNA polymerase subunit alpha [candidate division WWE3 bacterium]MCB9823756.1 DNA-directed RNA polymerase subunit alpha [Candidatus Nomurabacteria bacterium]MCB9826838.1 DNA-directed RNA polymerase subunit alpha [Candidatus Nomurabacteria bacterium]MCB9827551.1 DNA-directed RNA polymerase subunit alpha [Candidatus Nomurabacteria bacterium]HXK52424.1 DNA-directed RNA polymerase subunit alpha [bacterium]
MLLQPNEIKINKVSEKNSVGVFSFKPLPKGYGNTLGSSIRRVLLTSIKGAAVTQVTFPGITHQFTTIPGVKQDVVDLCLNMKEIVVRSHSDSPVIGTIKKKGKGAVTAGDIKISSEVEVINKDFVIAELADDKTTFEAELIIEQGVGYSIAESRETAKLGAIVIDALFSPVLKVSYEVTPTRKGDVTDLDELIITVQTDGAVKPEEALTEAATLLRNFFSKFASKEEYVEEIIVPASSQSDAAEDTTGNSSSKDDVYLEDLSLPTRTVNALRKHGIEKLSQLAKMTDEEIADVKNLGEKSVKEIIKLLEKENLR